MKLSLVRLPPENAVIFKHKMEPEPSDSGLLGFHCTGRLRGKNETRFALSTRQRLQSWCSKGMWSPSHFQARATLRLEHPGRDQLPLLHGREPNRVNGPSQNEGFASAWKEPRRTVITLPRSFASFGSAFFTHQTKKKTRPSFWRNAASSYPTPNQLTLLANFAGSTSICLAAPAPPNGLAGAAAVGAFSATKLPSPTT